MDDLNNYILDHFENDDLFPISSSLENEDIYHDGLSLLAQNDLFYENEHPLDDDLNSTQHWNDDHNHILGEDNHLSIHHEPAGLSEHKSDQVSFTGVYNDAEIRHFKDEVSKYQYEVSNLRSEVHHQEIMEDPSKLSKAVSDLNYAIDKLNDAQERLNNAT